MVAYTDPGPPDLGALRCSRFGPGAIPSFDVYHRADDLILIFFISTGPGKEGQT